MPAQTLQQAQGPLDRALGSAVLAALPSGWASCVLRVEETRDASGASLVISLQSPGSQGVAVVSDALMAAARALFQLYDQYGHSLRAIDYRFARRPDGRWSFSGDYSYR